MKISSRVVVVPQENIDTDQIIPARFLKVTDKAGIGAHLFEDRPEFQVQKGSGVLVATHQLDEAEAVATRRPFGEKAAFTTLAVCRWRARYSSRSSVKSTVES